MRYKIREIYENDCLNICDIQILFLYLYIGKPMIINPLKLLWLAG